MTEKKQFNNKEPKKQSFAGLAEELFRWYGEETFPANVSGDAAYILQAQRQRLRKKGLEMEYAMTSQDFFDEKKNGKVNMLFLRWKCEGDIIFNMDTGKKKKLSRSPPERKFTENRLPQFRKMERLLLCLPRASRRRKTERSGRTLRPLPSLFPHRRRSRRQYPVPKPDVPSLRRRSPRLYRKRKPFPVRASIRLMSCRKANLRNGRKMHCGKSGTGSASERNTGTVRFPPSMPSPQHG